MDNELEILETTDHPNIVRIYELLHDDKFYFIVSEYIRHGELYDFIVKKQYISELDVIKIIK
jgi:serine/threonine protein kinase